MLTLNAKPLPAEKTTGANQGPFSAWQGMTFSTWLRFLALRPAMDWGHAARISLCTACSVSNSVNKVLERMLYGRQIDNVQFPGPPLFILGHWRSGTTLLHNLLAQDDHYVTPNTYQILNPHHFLLTESTVTKLTAWMLPKTRPMDNMKFTWDAPQEDETALLNLTLSSPYIMAAFQGQREYYGRYFDMQEVPADELQRWKTAFIYFIKKLTVKSGRQILLKSPTHTYRIPLILELFPDARFVNIVRNPYAVFNSTMHMRRKMFEANGLAQRREGDMEEDVCLTYLHLFERYHADKHLIPSDRLYEIRYEELEQDPIGELRKVYEHCEWPGFELLEQKLATQVDGLREYQKNEFRMQPDLKRRLYDRLRGVFERYGYDGDLDDSGRANMPLAEICNQPVEGVRAESSIV